MRELYIDFDGVILDTIRFLYKALEESKVDTTDETAKREFYASYDFSTIINDENILNDSIECIKKLKESGRFQIHILSHINSLEEGRVKVKYIRKYFKDITIVLTPYGIEKTQMVHSKDAILVDDYSGNLREWIDKDGIAVKFCEEMDTNEFISINRLDELLTIFEDDNES